MSRRTIHYKLDVSAASTVVICALCGHRELGLDRNEAQHLIRQHLIRLHPATKAAASAQQHLTAPS